MINEVQDQQVTDYLIFHRLPLDILLEVKDHMISQVQDIQINENLNFDEAFLKTQKLWANEFKMTKYSVFFKELIPVIVKKIVREKYNNIIKRSLLFGLVSCFMVNFLFIYFSADQEIYNDLFRLYNSLVGLSPFLIWLFNSNMRKYVKRDFKYKGKLFYTMYQQNLGLYIASVNIVFQLILREEKYAFQFFRTDNPVGLFSLVLTLVLPYILHVIIIFVIINFFQHKKSLERMKDFIGITA